jgi:PAS domain S-box-containing protein
MKPESNLHLFLAPPPRSAWRRYTGSVLAVSLAVLARKCLKPAIGPTALPFISFFPAVAAAAWYGGFGPALLAIVLSGFAAAWFFLPPLHALAVGNLHDIAALGAFLVATLIIVASMQSMHRARAIAVAELAERKHVEAELRFSEQRARAFLDNSAIIAWLKDSEGRNIFLSDNYVRRFGLKQWQNKSDFELWPREIANEFRKNDLTVLQREAPFECIEEARTSDGNTSYWLNSKFWFQDVSGKKFVGGVGVDITQHKRTETALREQAALLQAINDNTTELIFMKDLAGHLTYANAPTLRVIGMTREQAIGSMDLDNFRQPAEHQPISEHDRHVAATGETLTVEEPYTCADGIKRVFLSTKSPLRDESGNIIGVVGVSRDITAQKRTEQALRDAHAQLADRAVHLEKLVSERTAKLQEMVGELRHVSYAITHDMRAPLRAMNGFAGAMLNQLSSARKSSSELVDFCRRIISAAARLDKLIQDSLSYTKAILKSVPLQPVDLACLVPSLIETYPNLQPDKADIAIEDPLPVVMGEESLLTQCFSNLLGNAVKFVSTGVRPKIRIRFEKAALSADGGTGSVGGEGTQILDPTQTQRKAPVPVADDSRCRFELLHQKLL